MASTTLSTPHRSKRSHSDSLRIQEFIPQLCAQLFMQNFQRELEWTRGNDSVALSQVLARNPMWTAEDVERMVRAYYASEGIRDAQPYEWLPSLAKFQYGPLDHQGVPKATLAAINAEVAQRTAKIDAEIRQKEADRKANDRQALLQSALAAVYQDLRGQGYEVFKAIGPTGCHLLATSDGPTRWVHAYRIVVRVDDSPVVANGAYYQALVKASALTDFSSSDQTQSAVVRYVPPLRGESTVENVVTPGDTSE